MLTKSKNIFKNDKDSFNGKINALDNKKSLFSINKKIASS